VRRTQTGRLKTVREKWGYGDFGAI
jgi:hypothetical protein